MVQFVHRSFDFTTKSHFPKTYLLLKTLMGKLTLMRIYLCSGIGESIFLLRETKNSSLNKK